MNAAIDAIDSYEKVKANLKINPQPQEISHKIFFYVPALTSMLTTIDLSSLTSVHVKSQEGLMKKH
jgi:hypothetical protein